MAIVVIVIGALTEHVAGYVVAGVAGGLFLAGIVVNILRSERTFDRLRKRIVGATHWPKESPT